LVNKINKRMQFYEGPPKFLPSTHQDFESQGSGFKPSDAPKDKSSSMNTTFQHNQSNLNMPPQNVTVSEDILNPSCNMPASLSDVKRVAHSAPRNTEEMKFDQIKK
jgi:hypothetical protein